MPRVFLSEGNSIKLPLSYLRRFGLDHCSDWWLEPDGQSLQLLPRVPDLRALYVEATTVCNLNCRTCIHNTWQDPAAHMERQLFSQLMAQVKAGPQLKRIVFGGLGEPLTHPHLLDLVEQARSLDLAVTLTTNGILLDQDVAANLIRLGVDRVIVSVDGVQEKTYADIRGAPLGTVLDHLETLKRLKIEMNSLKPALELEFVVLKSNREELRHLSSLARTLGATHVLVSNVLAYTEEMRGEVLYGYEPLEPFASGSWPVSTGPWVTWGTLDLPRMHWGAEQRCRFVQDRSTVVGWDGGVSPCYALAHSYSYFAVDGRQKQVHRYTLGQIEESPLLDIWMSEEYSRFRAAVRDFRFPSCPDCNLRDSCDFRENNEACWGWDPSCSDCLWAQDIIRCPGAGR